MLQDKKEVMGGSVQTANQFSHDNIDGNANDQSKHQPDPKIGTEIPKGPESKCKDGGDTSINVPGDNVGTDVISPPEGASDPNLDRVKNRHFAWPTVDPRDCTFISIC